MELREKQEHQTVNFDEALALLGIGKFNYCLILLAGVIIITTPYETVGVSFIFPLAECDLSLTTQHKGILSGVTAIGIILSSYFWGFLADQNGRKMVIFSSLIISFFFSLLSSVAVNFEMLAICRFFCGLFISGSSATIFAYLSEFHSSKHRSKALMAASFIFGILCNYVPGLGYLILNLKFNPHIPLFNVEFKPWRLYILMLGLPSLVSGIILLLFIPESPKFVYSKGDEEKALKILKKIHKINNPKDTKGYSVTKIIKDSEFTEMSTLEKKNVSENPFKLLWKQTYVLFSGSYAKKMIIMCLMQCGIFASCHSLYIFFPQIVDQIAVYSNNFPSGSATVCEILGQKEFMTNATESLEEVQMCTENYDDSTFVYSFILELLYMFGFLVITFIINRTTKLNVLLAILFGCSFCGFGALFSTIPVLSAYFFVVSMGVLLAVNVVSAATVDLFPTSMRGMAINISMMFGRIGSFIGTNISGYTLDNYCSETFAVSAGIMAACGVLAFFIPKIRQINGQRKDEEQNK